MGEEQIKRESLTQMVKYGNLLANLYRETGEKTSQEIKMEKVYFAKFRSYGRQSPLGEIIVEKYLQTYKSGLK